VNAASWAHPLRLVTPSDCESDLAFYSVTEGRLSGFRSPLRTVERLGRIAVGSIIPKLVGRGSNREIQSLDLLHAVACCQPAHPGKGLLKWPGNRHRKTSWRTKSRRKENLETYLPVFSLRTPRTEIKPSVATPESPGECFGRWKRAAHRRGSALPRRMNTPGRNSRLWAALADSRTSAHKCNPPTYRGC